MPDTGSVWGLHVITLHIQNTAITTHHMTRAHTYTPDLVMEEELVEGNSLSGAGAEGSNDIGSP